MCEEKKEVTFIYSLALELYNNDLTQSSILLSEYLYRLTHQLEPLVVLLKGLLKIECDTRIVRMLEENGHLLKDKQIKMIYLKAKHRSKEKERARIISSDVSLLVSSPVGEMKNNSQLCETNENILNKINDGDTVLFCDNQNRVSNKININFNSILKFFEALTKPDKIKTSLLIESYKLDNLNLESLFYLFKEERISQMELRNLIGLGNKTIQKISSVLFYDPETDEGALNLFTGYRSCFYELPFYNPFYIFSFSKDLFYKKNNQLLFNLSFASFKLYPNSVYTYLSLALYFLLQGDFKETKKCLLKGADIEKNGYLYLYLGICYSGMRECENAVSCFFISQRMLVESWKPLYYLAWEHQKMTNYDRAINYYKEALKIEKNDKLQEKYVSLLIFCEFYEEALSYLASRNKPKHHLLRVFCLLFKGRINDSKGYLSLCEVDWRFYATSGYIEHLLNNLELAADFYSKSLLIHSENVIEDLMTLAIENIASKTENDVYRYCTELFECLFSKSNDFDVV